MRHGVECPIFGPPKDFNTTQLPTKADVLRCCLETRRSLGVQRETNKETTLKEILEIVSEKLEALWKKSGIPFVSHRRIQTMITSYHSQYTAMKTILCSKSMTQASKDKQNCRL
jgi:hypothetical protein